MKRFCTIVIFLTVLMFFVTGAGAAEQTKGPAKKGYYV